MFLFVLLLQKTKPDTESEEDNTYPIRKSISGKDRPCFPVKIMPILSMNMFSYPINIPARHSNGKLQELVGIYERSYTGVEAV